MKINFSKVSKVDLKRIYCFTMYKSNNKLTKQILDLSEIASSIDVELRIRAVNA